MGKKKKKTASGPRLRKELRPKKTTDKEKATWTRHYIWIVGFMCILSFFVHNRAADYIRRQGMITFDESIYAKLAFQIKNGGAYSTQDIYEQQKAIGRSLPAYVNRPVFHHPPFYTWLVSLSYSFMEQKDTYGLDELYTMAAKVANVAGCGLILMGFLFGRRLFNPHVGLLAAFLLAFEFNLMMTSSRVWMDSVLALGIWVSLYCLYRSLDNKNFFYIAGITTGLTVLTKYPGVLIFPIFLSYAVLYHRDVFKTKEFYFFLFISLGMMVPWFHHNISVFGFSEYMEKMGQAGYRDRLLQYAEITGVLGVLTAGLIAIKRCAGNKKAFRICSWMPWVGVSVIAFFFGYLVLQKPFWISFAKSWAWQPDILLGWKMGLYKEEPWYFYLKQHLEYSLFYAVFIVGSILAFKRGKQDVFCVLVAGWVLAFGILWGNYQGRYVVSFPVAAMLIVAVTMWRYGCWLRQQKHIAMRLLMVVSVGIFVYALTKTAHVGYVYCLNDSIAYF